MNTIKIINNIMALTNIKREQLEALTPKELLKTEAIIITFNSIGLATNHITVIYK